MRKIIALLLVVIMVLGLVGCRQKEVEPETPTGQQNQEVVKPDKETTPTTKPDVEATEHSETEPEVTEPEVTEPEFVFDGTANPIEDKLDPANLPDGTYHIKIENGGVASPDGVKPVSVNAALYNYEKYDVRELSWLSVGDKLIINGKEVTVTEYDVTKMGVIMINGGLGQDGYEFFEDKDGYFYSIGYSDKKTFYKVGNISIPVSDDFVYYDSSDLDKEAKKYTLNDFTINDVYFEYAGGPDNATIVIKDGKVVEMTIGYMP